MGKSIPIQLTRFIGRERETGDVKRLLADKRLLTLTGPGGSGKTRLAAVVAAQVRDGYEDGIIWVNLATVADESLVAQTVAAAQAGCVDAAGVGSGGADRAGQIKR